MRTLERFPSFGSRLAELNQFLPGLAADYQAGRITAWASLDARVKTFFTMERMDSMEAIVPGWHKMASYSSGVTLTHVMCVFLGLLLLPEFASLAPEQQELLKWMVLFHDLEKEVEDGERDARHGFRSAVAAARQLPHLGFAVTTEYDASITSWSRFAYSAMKISASCGDIIQDNEKLPGILAGVERMFGAGTAAELIVKGTLLHMSITILGAWPQAAPLTEVEVRDYIGSDLVSLLRVLMLADNDGWVLFDAVREQQRIETLAAFERIGQIIAG